MCTKLLLALCLFGFIYKSHAASASFITKCKWDDSKCIKESTQAAIPKIAAGIPELGVETLDPFKIKSLDASSSSLKLLLHDISGTGLKDCVAKKMQRDKEKSTLSVKFLCTVDVTAKYEMKGQMLFLPIEGKGDAHVLLRKLLIAANLDMVDKVGDDGKDYWRIKDYTYSYDLKDKADIELENLFDGNEDLSRAIRELFANSSNDVFAELGPPIVKAVFVKIVDIINDFLGSTPKSELEM